MKKCSYPGCEHVASYEILNSHAKVHGFRTVKEMEKVHGSCGNLQASSDMLSWARKSTTFITDAHYNEGQFAIGRLSGKRKLL